MSWAPVADGELARRAWRVVEEIAEAIGDVDDSDPTLANGHAGIALFFAYLWRIRGEERHGDLALAHLDRATAAVAELEIGPELFTGFAGPAWVVHHLSGPEFADDPNDATADIDDALLEHLRQPTWAGDYDLTFGLTGLGIYALDHPIPERADTLLDRILGHLEALAVPDDPGITWHTAPELLRGTQSVKHPDGYFSLGLAHGVPGTIAMLARAATSPGVRERALAMLHPAATWVLAQRRDPQDGTALYPAMISGPRDLSSRRPATLGRSAWCYGDPGICAALWSASHVTGESAWLAAALELAERESQRPVDTVGIVDGGLCHGAASLAHLFNRFFQASGDARFGAAARRYYTMLLEMRQPGHGLAGYAALLPGDAPGSVEAVGKPGFLTGCAGIGLALMAACSDVAPSWDTPLLTTLPVR